MAKISKTSTFEAPKFFSEFFSPSFCWVLPVAWPRAAAPEAKHRCTWQPAKATIPWPSGSSRRRRPWMRRTKMAVASEEDLVGKSHETWDSVVKCMQWRESAKNILHQHLVFFVAFTFSAPLFLTVYRQGMF